MTSPNESQDKILSNKQIKYLRGIGHKLSPLVLVGKEGLSESLVAAVAAELDNHELIKVKIGNNSGVDKKHAAAFLPQSTSSFLVQLIGKTLLLYRENPERDKENRIKLPKSEQMRD